MDTKGIKEEAAQRRLRHDSQLDGLRNGLIYLASPYSHPELEVRERRFHEACKVAAVLMQQGIVVFSPIAHTHPICKFSDLPFGFEFYKKFDCTMLNFSLALVVLQIEGWEFSEGIVAEVSYARSINIPIYFLDHNKGMLELPSQPYTANEFKVLLHVPCLDWSEPEVMKES